MNAKTKKMLTDLSYRAGDLFEGYGLSDGQKGARIEPRSVATDWLYSLEDQPKEIIEAMRSYVYSRYLDGYKAGEKARSSQ